VTTDIADYRIVNAIDTGGALVCGRADAPPRLPGGPVTVWVLPPIPVSLWTGVRTRLSRLSAVAGPGLPRWLEAGLDRWGQTDNAWVSAALDARTTMATAPEDSGPADRLRALAQAARGVHALHEAGLLHGGVFPGNVLLDETGGGWLGPASLTDGVTQLLHAGYPPFAFVDPQLVRGNGGRWSDIWALGATALAVLDYGSRLPELDNVAAVASLGYLLRAGSPALDDVGGPAAEVARACLQRDPADRPSTAAEVADRLEQAAQSW
jgi:hypothetical protein